MVGGQVTFPLASTSIANVNNLFGCWFLLPTYLQLTRCPLMYIWTLGSGSMGCCDFTHMNAPSSIYCFEAIQLNEPQLQNPWHNFRTLKYIGRLSGKWEPNVKSVHSMYHPSTVVCLWVLIHSSARWLSLFFSRTLSSFTNKDTWYEKHNW
jgi:hypothetical protein